MREASVAAPSLYQSYSLEEVAAKYGVLMPNPPGFANRWTVYIDKEGKISYIEKTVRPATSAEDMVAKLAELKVPMVRH